MLTNKMVGNKLQDGTGCDVGAPRQFFFIVIILIPDIHKACVSLKNTLFSNNKMEVSFVHTLSTYTKEMCFNRTQSHI